MSAIPVPRPRRLLGVVLFAVTFLAVLGLLHLFVVRPLFTRAGSGGPPPLPRLGSVPAFSLASHLGTPLTDRDLRGSVVVADFVFLRCGGTCPVMTAAMAGLARRLEKDAAAVRFVSFDVDPEHDTVEALAAFAKETGAVAPRWLFLHGRDRGTIRAISRQGFHLAVEDGTAGDTEPILHSTRFVLVDRKGTIRGTYDGTDPASVETLEHDARRLLQDPAA